MVYKIDRGLYRITVGLSGNPLKSLNSYVLTGRARNLLIDTGFNLPQCRQDLQDGIRELGLEMSSTDIFVTHLHADHSGQVTGIAAPTSRIFMSQTDKEILDETILSTDTYWQTIETAYQAEGYPVAELTRTRQENPSRNYVTERSFEVVPVTDGMILPFAGRTLKCIHTPGHTPGHMCLYDEEHGIFFSGDHILFDITPNITTWPTMPDALAQYLNSLKKVAGLPVTQTLTGHRENLGDFRTRIGQLLNHHDERLAETMAIIRADPGVSGYDVAGRMKWSIRAKNWAEFPSAQRRFAVGETIAHLNCLVEQGTVERRIVDGVSAYYPLY